MKERKERTFAVAFIAAAAALLLFGFPQVASAQHEIFAASQKSPTSVPGVGIIQDRPAGFNPLTASADQLSKYGLPPRPDKATDPQGYTQWASAMSAIKYRASDVKAMPYSSKNMMLAKNQPAAGSSQAISAAPTYYLSYNWSGVANTNKLTYWNPNTSFTSIQSIFNVPAAQPPFDACGNGITGGSIPGFYEVTWNGIDGFSNGDVIQGGSLSYADCGGPADNFYIGWVEWYPSYPILEIVCSTSPLEACPVNAGDDFYVITYGADSGTQDVFVEDITQEWYGTFAIAYITGPLLVGSSEEQIVERPGAGGGLTALANYIVQFMGGTYGYDGRGTQFYAGLQNPATAIISMLDDDATELISWVPLQGTAGSAGKYSLTLQSTGCAYVGGCTP